MKKTALGGIGALLILICMLALFLKPETLPEYIEPEPEEKVETVGYETSIYETPDFSIPYPVGWATVNDGNTCKFVDPATAATIEISRMSYMPSINMVNSEIIARNVQDAGSKFIDFAKLSNCAYRTSYTNNDVANIEYVFWDLNNIYIVVGKYLTKDYSAVYDKLVYCIERFAWNGNKIPVGFHINYYNYGNFALTIKDSWGLSESSDTIYINDPDYGSYITVTVSESAQDFSDITQLAFTEHFAVNKTDYIQSSFVNNGNEITANATYTLNGDTVEQYQWFIATGENQFRISVEYYSRCYEEVGKDLQTFLNGFYRY